MTQETDYQPYDPFPAETHEAGLDKLTQICQQQQTEIDRSLKANVDTPAGTEYTLPVPEQDAGLYWEDVSNPTAVVNGPSARQIEIWKDEAETAADNADTSAAAAAISENKAFQWAENPEDVEVEPGEYSAYHWAQKAATFNPGNYVLKAGDTMTGPLLVDNGTTFDPTTSPNNAGLSSKGNYGGGVVLDDNGSAQWSVFLTAGGDNLNFAYHNAYGARDIQCYIDQSANRFYFLNGTHPYYEGSDNDYYRLEYAGGWTATEVYDSNGNRGYDYYWYNKTNDTIEWGVRIFDRSQVATAKFKVADGEAYVGSSTFNKIWHEGNDGAGSGLDADLLDGQHGSYYAPLASPSFTGNPIAPTPTAGDNDTSIATTAFVQTAIASAGGFVAGMEMLWPNTTPPTGWLEEDGSAISRTTYAALFAEIGTMYGTGDGSTTFNLPDARGVVLRGWDHGAGVDPDAASRTDRGDGTTGDNVGTNQADEVVAHSHDIGMYNHQGGPATARYGGGTTHPDWQTRDYGGNETRMINTNRMVIIKY